MDIFLVKDRTYKLDGGQIFGVVPRTIWQNLCPPDEDNLIDIPINCLLIVEGDKKVLIDCGLGHKQSERFFSFLKPYGQDIVASLAQVGVSPADITDVIFTHLHFDHCGGAVLPDGSLGFPNATYWVNKTHWEWAIAPNQKEKASFLQENILPIATSGQLSFLDIAQSPFSFLSFLEAHGHSIGQLIVLVDDKEKERTIAFWGDVIPSVAHFPSHYVPSFDIQPLKSIAEKQQLMDLAYENNYVMVLQHEMNTPCCTIKKTEKGYEVDRVVELWK